MPAACATARHAPTVQDNTVTGRTRLSQAVPTPAPSSPVGLCAHRRGRGGGQAECGVGVLGSLGNMAGFVQGPEQGLCV